MQNRWGVRCLSIEANPSLCAVWNCESEVINAAVAGQPGTVDFFICNNSESSSLFERLTVQPISCVQVTAMTLEQILGNCDRTRLRWSSWTLRVPRSKSVPGSERHVYSGRFQQISVEFHDLH